MKKKIQPISDFEHDMLWMSCRYAIGRHTIASCMLAHDILSNMYERLLLSPRIMEDLRYDINREICDSLKCSYNIRIENYDTNPFDILGLKFEDEDFCLDKRLFSQATRVTLDEDCVMHVEDIPKMEGFSEFYIMDLDDLQDWAHLSKILDMRSHYEAILTNDEKVECVDLPFITRIKQDEEVSYGIEYRTVDVKSYIKNKYTFIPSENIKEIIIKEK